MAFTTYWHLSCKRGVVHDLSSSLIPKYWKILLGSIFISRIQCLLCKLTALIQTFVIFHLNYCYSYLTGLPVSSLAPLQFFSLLPLFFFFHSIFSKCKSDNIHYIDQIDSFPSFFGGEGIESRLLICPWVVSSALHLTTPHLTPYTPARLNSCSFQYPMLSHPAVAMLCSLFCLQCICTWWTSTHVAQFIHSATHPPIQH